MLSGLRWTGIAGLLVMLAAGCTNDADAAPQPTRSSAAVQPAAATWRGFSSGCPALTAPPYGIASTGKRVASYVAAGERETLDRVVPGAVFDQVTCTYSAPGKASPLVMADVKIFGGDAGATQASALFQSEQSASARGDGGVDNADVPGLADGAFAIYFEPMLFVYARSGNAYVSVKVLPGMAIVRTFDQVQPLQQQVPVLTPVVKDVLTGLK